MPGYGMRKGGASIPIPGHPTGAQAPAVQWWNRRSPADVYFRLEPRAGGLLEEPAEPDGPAAGLRDSPGCPPGPNPGP